MESCFSGGKNHPESGISPLPRLKMILRRLNLILPLCQVLRRPAGNPEADGGALRPAFDLQALRLIVIQPQPQVHVHQAEAVVSVAKGAGFEFTADEFLSAGAPKDSKLDMDELDAVAGGKKRAGAGCFIIGVGWGGASVGGGGNACWVIGIGGGVTWEAT